MSRLRRLDLCNLNNKSIDIGKDYVDFNNFGIVDINYTSGGVLYKYVEKDIEGNPQYLYKSGVLLNKRFSSREAVIECICSEILDYLEIPHAIYTLAKSKLSLTSKWISQEILISKSKWFLNESKEIFVHASKIVPEDTFRKPLAYYNILDLLPNLEDDLNNMILFDFLVNNTDRHFKNFGFVTNIETEETRLSPLYDHGFCLGIEYDSEYLSMVLDDEEDDLDFDLEENLHNSDTCKSFGTSNRSCLSLVKSSKLLQGKSLDVLLEIIDKYADYLPKNNIEFAKIILTTRYKILEERYGN